MCPQLEQLAPGEDKEAFGPLFLYNLVMLKDRRGFTLIEIVLVLAIAGFVLIMVFLAITGAQRSRRDEHRQTDLGRIYGAIETYNSANALYPTTAAFSAFWSSNYITNLALASPAGGTYTLGAGWPANAVRDTVYYRQGQTCDGATTNYGYSVKMGMEIGQVCRSMQ